MKKILVIADYYLPGYKAGGPIRTIANMIDWLGGDFDFYIVTADRDLGDLQSYKGIEPGEWMTVGKAQVRYLTPFERSLSGWADTLQHINYDAVYLNSFFSAASVKIMWLRRWRRIPRQPVIIAPRGEFYPGALGLKSLKKRVYLVLAKLLGIYRDVTVWQASTPDETETIEAVLRSAKGKIAVAPNLTARSLPEMPARPPKTKGDKTKIIFLSRISRKKNLDYALKLLVDVKCAAQFDIYGTLEDKTYWDECQALMTSLPANIHVEYRGAVEPERIIETFAGYHLFLFPTRGENFGHVIWEALYAGCPVLISDQTPWRNLEEKGIGWDIPLDEPERFIQAIKEVIGMDEATFRQHSQAVRDYAKRVAHDEAVLEANRQLFIGALEA